MNIGKIYKSLWRHSPVEQFTARMRDGRQRPVISAGTVGRCVIEMVPLGQKGLLEVDQYGRREEVRRWHGTDREMVVSDTTLSRSLASFDMDVVRAALEEQVKRQKKEEMTIRLKSGRTIRMGIVDGSDFGGFHAAVLCFSGKIQLVADLEMYAGRGHELAATERLLARGKGHFGKGKAELLATDGLYLNQYHLRQCREELGCHALIKTTDEKLEVVQDAKELFFSSSSELAAKLERVSGVDSDRGIRYEITAAAGFRWQNLPFALKVAFVRQTYLKPKRNHPTEETFWIITTDESPTAEDMLEIVHRRWDIENLVFRRLNMLVGSKRHLTKDAHVREALLGLWFLGLNLLNVFIARTGIGHRNPHYPTMRQTWKAICRSIYVTVISGCTDD